MSASRMQRWAVILMNYNFEIKHVKGIQNCSADCLSRLLPQSSKSDISESDFEDFNYLNYFGENIFVTNREQLDIEIESDEILKTVSQYVLYGWPDQIDDKFEVYKQRENEITVENDCLMWGHRVIVPKSLRQVLLNDLHDAHMSIVRMKALARSYIWWPSIDRDIESLTKSCELCLTNAKNPPKAALHVWDWPEKPNDRIHVDFLGPVQNSMYIAITDAFSKWIDKREFKNITSNTTIDILKDYICTWGIPKRVVSDNGPAFRSDEMNRFMKSNAILHTLTAPYHPASNGATENSVKTFKSKFKLLLQQGFSKKDALFKYLFHFRSTPHCTTGISPTELQISRKLRTRWEILVEDARQNVKKKQSDQKKYFRGNRRTEFEKDQVVMAKDYSNKNWKKA